MSRFIWRVCALLALSTAVTTTAAAQTPAVPPATGQPSPNQAPLVANGAVVPTFEVTGGYQLLRVPDQTLPFGLNLDGAWNLGANFAAVGEIGWAYRSETDGGIDSSIHLWNVGFGPRWEMRKSSVWPFAQVLVGAAHARANTTIADVDLDSSATRFMVQPGVGVNVVAGDGWGVVGQVDYRRVFLDEEDGGESGENQVRVFLGLRMILD